MLESARYLTMAYITSESCTRDIPWETNTHETKIYTSPSHIVMKNWYIYIGPTAKPLCLIFFISVKWFLKYSVLENHPHGVKKVHVQGFPLITPLIMYLEKHSRAHCKANKTVFLTMYLTTCTASEL
jgi:hypothetical protein